MKLLCGENCMILTSTVFDWSTRVTDRQTDRQTDGRNCDSICALTAYMLSRAKNMSTKLGNGDTITLLMFSSNVRKPTHKKLHCKLSSLFLMTSTTWRMSRRHMPPFGSYSATQSRSACSSTATDVYFTPSDVRARSSVVMPVVVKTFPWQPHHMIQTLDRFSSRRLELQQPPSYLAQRWMFWRRWSLSSSASWYSGVSQHLSAYSTFLGLARTPLQLACTAVYN